MEAVLRSVDQMLSIEIAARDQTRLGESLPGQEVELTVTLEEGETIPADFAPPSFVSAGLYFKIVSSQVQDRTISLRVQRL